MNDIELFRQGTTSIRVSKQVAAGAVSLLKRAEYGTRGIRYQQTGQQEKILQLRKPLFFNLFEEGTFIGMYCLDERELGMGTNLVKGFYGRYLAVAKPYTGKGYGHLLKQQAIRYVTEQVSQPFLLYSYIEEKNTRSLIISEKEGFNSVGQLKTFIFRRYAPRIAPRFDRLLPSERSELLSGLAQRYQDYSFKTFTTIGSQDNYYVIREGNDIVAGVQATSVTWRFLAMPGVAGWTMMHLLPMMSATRRFFNPSNYQFVVIEGLYLKAGHEKMLYPLMESVLANFKLHSVLWQIDSRDPVISSLSNAASGLLSGFQGGVKTHVMLKSIGIPLPDLHLNLPVYVSSFDFV